MAIIPEVTWLPSKGQPIAVELRLAELANPTLQLVVGLEEWSFQKIYNTFKIALQEPKFYTKDRNKNPSFNLCDEIHEILKKLVLGEVLYFCM